MSTKVIRISRFMNEHSRTVDSATGTLVQQVTGGPFISHPTYFLQSSFSHDGKQLFFTSYRSGSAQLHVLAYPDGEIHQLTQGPAIHPYSAALSPDGAQIFYTAEGTLMAVGLHGGTPRTVFAAAPGTQLGEVSLSRDGNWGVCAMKRGGQNGLLIINLALGSAREILFERTVIHPQFHPLEPEWIEFAADPAPRMFRIRRDGTGLECLHQHDNSEFVVHETFLGQTGDLVFTIWPHSLCRMDWTTRQISTICDFNAWHIAPNRAGTEILCDTNHPDRGLFRIDVASGSRELVCLTESSNAGSQWRKATYALPADFAAAQSEAQGEPLSWMEAKTDTVYGPQWTHPHPAYSYDEKLATFASDRTGVTQVYVVDLSTAKL